MAITTVYGGIEYRSRLEARWAAFMSNIGWDTVYEPFDGDGYIPDFLVQGQRPFLIEVKPAATLAGYRDAVAKADSGLASHWDSDVLIVGASPLPHIGADGSSGGDYPALGWFREGGDWWYGRWITCLRCGRFAVYHDQMSYGGRPCWCESGGDHHLGAVKTDLIESFWADACNDVKWRGRAA